ncbi:PREDICTED: ras-related protein Rab-37-like isoform X1 [Ceratosolen solmsi marchali]|uniref:Ras-related protein Rab-37-like isoform X1 n=1 Tax=Ceratosolen solmsi marchali TaxID=326594 RepID=A0AAJ6YRD5_9HYME|nr:PREDICTED: ras-related protein Rab-37-like isoform X1 [Ceratosolen solmsi marchali]
MKGQEVVAARAAKQQQGPMHRAFDWLPTAANSKAPSPGPGNPHHSHRQSSNDSLFSAQATPEHCDLHCKNKMVTVDDSHVKLQIWDTAGQERFRSVTHAYYRDAHALLLLYDVTNKQSYDNIRAWLGEIREYAQDDVVIMLLGNKCDCGAERVVRREDGQRLANEYKVPFMETSAKTGLNVELAFHAVARELKARTKKEYSDESKFNVQEYLGQHQSHRNSCLATNCLTT